MVKGLHLGSTRKFRSRTLGTGLLLSGYSSRINKVIRKMTTQFLYRVQVVREVWSKLNLENPSVIDVEKSLYHVELGGTSPRCGRVTVIDLYIGFAAESGLALTR